MHGFISLVGVLAAVVLCAVSGAMNYLYLSSLGKTPLEGQVLGTASAAADVLKALLPFFIAWSWEARRFVASVSGALAFVFFAVFSLLSAIGFAAENRGVMVDRRDELTAAYQRVQQDLAIRQSQLADLQKSRPPTVIAEAIASHRQSRRWTATSECTSATESQSREYCASYFALRAELAAGEKAELLRTQMAILVTDGANLRKQGAGQDQDPQVSLLSQISGISAGPVRLALIVAVALLVEIGASLGLFLASGHRFGEIAPAMGLESAAARPDGSVEDFCLEALIPESRSKLGRDLLFEAYRAWCEQANARALAAAGFADEFDRLAEAVGLPKFDDEYLGIALAASRGEHS